MIDVTLKLITADFPVAVTICTSAHEVLCAKPCPALQSRIAQGAVPFQIGRWKHLLRLFDPSPEAP